MYFDEWFPLALIGALVLGCGTCAGSCMTGCDRGYSQGERIGTVYKFSKKGLMWKTWEGEMNLGGVVAGQNGGDVANVWGFTVSDEKWIPEVQRALDGGYPVKVGYIQWWIAKQPVTETGYEVVSVDKVAR